MASPLGHTAAALALGVALRPTSPPRRFWVLAAVCSLLPDLDFFGRLSGSRQLEALLGGHRALTHSIPSAILVALLVVLVAFAGSEWRPHRGRLWLSFAAATASHGLVDSLTNYGAGVALLAPISWTRVKAPWQPLGHGPCRGTLDCLAGGLGGELLWPGVAGRAPGGNGNLVPAAGRQAISTTFSLTRVRLGAATGAMNRGHHGTEPNTRSRRPDPLYFRGPSQEDPLRSYAYKGYTISPRTFQLRGSARWTLDLLIGRNGQLRAFGNATTYATEAGADIACADLGCRIIDGTVRDCTVADLH